MFLAPDVDTLTLAAVFLKAQDQEPSGASAG